MTFSAIKHISYAAAGGFTAGWVAGAVLTNNVSVRAAGAAYPYFRHTGLVLGAAAAVARAVDEVFKALGWTGDAGMRLLAAHIVTGIAIARPVYILISEATPAAKLVTLALTVSSLAINVIVK